MWKEHPSLSRTNAVTHEVANEQQRECDMSRMYALIGNIRVEREQRKHSHGFGVGAGISAPGWRDYPSLLPNDVVRVLCGFEVCLPTSERVVFV